MIALARKIVSGEQDETETVEQVFAHATETKVSAEELLVDDGWKPVEVEPEAVSVNGNGLNGNGHNGADGLGPTVELVLKNGHEAAQVNGDVNHDKNPEAEHMLFSWEEFLVEEYAEPKGRIRTPKPAGASLFEWALTTDYEKESVGAGR